MASAPEERPQGSRPPPSRPPPPDLLTSGRTSFEQFKTWFNKAHQNVEKGLSFDEENNDPAAKEQYKLALQHINSAMLMDLERLNFTSDEKESGREMQQKLTKTRLQVEYRLQAIEAAEMEANSYPNLEDRMAIDAPPSYDEVTSNTTSMCSLGDSIMNDEQNQQPQEHANADRILEIEDGVQIFFITADGNVSAPSYPSSMSLFRFREDTLAVGENPPSFLQVNDWIYPLIPGTSPALKTSYGAYMFPDTASNAPGAAVGLMLPDTMEAAQREQFEKLLRTLTVMEDQYPEGATAQAVPQEPCPAYSQVQYPQVPSAPEEIVIPRTDESENTYSQSTTSAKISKGILVAADWISWGLSKGAEKTGVLIKYGSEKFQEKLKPEETARPVNPKVQKGAQYVRRASHVAVQVSGYVVTKLGEATVALGRKAAPHIRRQGEKILPQVFKTSKDGSSKLDGVLEVAASGLKGFGTVFMGLETAAKILGRSIASETVHIVKHKYGAEAGNVTENTLYSVGNVAMTAYNADSLGVKAIAKRAAKDTGKAVLYDIQDRRDNNQCEANKVKDTRPDDEKTNK